MDDQAMMQAILGAVKARVESTRKRALERVSGVTAAMDEYLKAASAAAESSVIAAISGDGDADPDALSDDERAALELAASEINEILNPTKQTADVGGLDFIIFVGHPSEPGRLKTTLAKQGIECAFLGNVQNEDTVYRTIDAYAARKLRDGTPFRGGIISSDRGLPPQGRAALLNPRGLHVVKTTIGSMAQVTRAVEEIRAKLAEKKQ